MSDPQRGEEPKPGFSWMRLLPVLVFLLHFGLYLSWLVDDAGISLAYARHIAGGFGPVAQPGLAPVEGYSNPLWTALFIPLFRLGLVWIPGTPKVVALFFGLLGFLLLDNLARAMAPRAPGQVALATGLMTALNPAVVLWISSGLENALYFALVLALIELLRRSLSGLTPTWGAGLTAAALALTRPDGLMLAVAPLLLFATEEKSEPSRWRGYLLGFSIPYMLHLGWRWMTFGAWVPNTYFAKVPAGPSAVLHAASLSPKTLLKLSDLGTALAGPELGVWLVLGCAFGGVALFYKEETTPAARCAVVMAAAALAAYGIMPRDWMGEVRFATALIPLIYLVTFTAVAEITPRPQAGELAPLMPARVRVLALLVGVIVAALPSLRWRALQGHRAPPISLDYVYKAYVEGPRTWRKELDLESVSLLLPDIGAVILDAPELRVYDLAGLTDKTLARLLHGPRGALREHVLEVLKPTFIHANPAWAPELNLGQDPRFARDYVDFYRYPRLKDFEFEYAQPGYYVRRDVLKGKPGALERLRSHDLSWKALAPKPAVGFATLALAIWPLPIRAGWFPVEPEGSQSPGRRRRMGFGKIRLDEVPEKPRKKER